MNKILKKQWMPHAGNSAFGFPDHNARLKIYETEPTWLQCYQEPPGLWRRNSTNIFGSGSINSLARWKLKTIVR